MKTNVSEINGEARDDLVKVILRVAEKVDPRTATSACPSSDNLEQISV